MNHKAFTLIELLVVVAIIGILAAVGVVGYSKYTTLAKITAAKEQHANIKKFIEASYGQCALGESYIVMKTCDNGSWFCKGLSVGKTPPGIVNRPCKYGAGSASNSTNNFTIHFQYSGLKNTYGLTRRTNTWQGGAMPDQCCLMSYPGSNPILGGTDIWSSYGSGKIGIRTNIGDSKGNNVYLTGHIDWPTTGFR
jgi:prepilin-type N-terminal cleavage/methylation domain-containing protein